MSGNARVLELFTQWILVQGTILSQSSESIIRYYIIYPTSHSLGSHGRGVGLEDWGVQKVDEVHDQ